MNSQKHLLLQRFKEILQKEQGELLYFLDRKEKNSQKYDEYTKELTYLISTQVDTDRKERLEKKIAYINRIQSDILRIIQPIYHQVFDKVAEDVPPGSEYNEELRQDLWFDIIFWERDISWSADCSRENYWHEYISRTKEERYQKKIEKHVKEQKKQKEKVWLPKNHRLVTDENYKSFVQDIGSTMEKLSSKYTKLLSKENTDPEIVKQIIERYFLYLLVWSLIEQQIVFDIKSSKWGKWLELVIQELVQYFHEKYWSSLDIDQKYITKKLWNNLKIYDTYPLDLSYEHVLFEDIEYREKYLDSTYFFAEKTNSNKIRIDIMKEYNTQKWLRDMSFELLNPLYHIYKQDEAKHQKHLSILLDYQKNMHDQDPHTQEIIEDIKKKLLYAQEKKKEHTTCIESAPDQGKEIYDHSLTEIRNKLLKRYKVPFQYRHIFGIVMNKNNNFYQIKANMYKKSDEINSQLTQNMINSERREKDIIYCIRNYITFKYMDEMFDKEWSKKRNDRKIKVHHMITDKRELKKKKTNNILDSQLRLDI